MTYLVFCTFDLNGGSPQDYANAYSDLERIGLSRVQKTGQGRDTVIPTTSAMGALNGSSAASLRDDIRAKVKTAFSARRFKSEIFVIVGGDWAWGAATT